MLDRYWGRLNNDAHRTSSRKFVVSKMRLFSDTCSDAPLPSFQDEDLGWIAGYSRWRDLPFFFLFAQPSFHFFEYVV